MIFFGCANDNVGHYLVNKNGRTVRDSVITTEKLDGVHCPRRSDEHQEEGVANVVQALDHTILAFWDRSVDRRFGSNAAFIEPGAKSFNEMLLIASQGFPHILKRFRFKIVQNGAKDD